MSLLSQITSLWLSQIELAENAKERQFGRQAARAWKYLGRDYSDFSLDYGNEHDFMDAEQGSSRPVVVGKSQEFVALMLPYIHAKVPHRMVSPSRPPLPAALLQAAGEARAQLDAADATRAWLLQFWLGYIAHDGYDLAFEARLALPEALVKGQAILWHELSSGPYGPMPVSSYDSIDSLLIDADATRIVDANFIVRKRKMSVYRLAKQLDIDPDTLRGQYESGLSKSIGTLSLDTEDKGDVAEYYEIWSRMGVGHNLVGAPDDMKEARGALDTLGQFSYLIVMRGVDHPLNLPPHVLESDDVIAELRERLAWPMPLYEDTSAPWPCSVLQFYPNSHDPWGQSPLAGGLQSQIFLDCLYHFVMRRVRATSRDIIVVAEALAKELKDALESGVDQAIVTVSGKPGEDLRQLIEILQFPTVNEDLWSVFRMIEQQFERATGMTPLLSGAQPDAASRSATDVRARETHMTSRPDDFADCVEDWMSRISAKEAQITRLHVPPPFELLGETRPPEGQPLDESTPLALAWSQLVTTNDPVVAASELSYTVEAGSGRRRNKQKFAADAQFIMQSLAPIFSQYAFLTGDMRPVNALTNVLGEANDIPVGDLMLPNIPPPAPEGKESGD